VSMRADVDETGGQRISERVPRERHTVVGKRATALEEVGRDVERDRHSMALQDRQGNVGEVGRPVVEGHGHERAVGDAPSLGDAGETLSERHDVTLGSEKVHLLVEERSRQVDFDRRTLADAVVNEHDESGTGMTHDVGGSSSKLEGSTRDGVRHGAEATEV